MRRHLADPELTPVAVAAAHHLSLRSLHRLFDRHHGRRPHPRPPLERCLRDLADPRLHARSVHEVARPCGFPDPAHFSRAFRARYGMSPREHRERAARRWAHAGGEGP